MRNLWDKDRNYSLLRVYVDMCTRASYRRLRVSGSLPEGEAFIIAPNHTGTLMDALVVLQSRPQGTVFGARADIFRKPVVARIMHFLKIVPMVRARDGIREVARNRETMQTIGEVLAHGLPFCMFPEGRHRPMHSLLPLKKGVARIAFESAAQRRTLLVPAGIEYDDFFHYRGTCALRYGEPIDVNAFLTAREGAGEAQLTRELLDELADRMKGLILYIPDDGNYEAVLREKRPPRRPWWRWLLAPVILPFWLLSAVLSLPLWATAEYIAHCKVQDPAFRNTVRFGVRLAGTPVLLIIWAVAAFLLLNPWLAALLLVYFIHSYSIFYDGLNLLRR